MHVETGRVNLFTVETVVFSGHYFVTIWTLLVPSGHNFFSFMIISIIIIANYVNSDHRITIK